MNRIGLIIGIGTAALLVCISAPVIVLGAFTIGCTPIPSTPPSAEPANNNWDAEQIDNAKAIVTIGVQRQIPARGQIIALATAMQESGASKPRQKTGSAKSKVST